MDFSHLFMARKVLRTRSDEKLITPTPTLTSTVNVDVKTMARWQAILGLALAGLCAVVQVGAIELATIHTHKMGEWKEGSDFVFLHTCFGIIPIRLFRENAPELTRRIYELAEKGNCARCTFYRAEARHEVRTMLACAYGG
ncbi:hypothetical protein H632_c3374p0 [Helicosporidium sp. ATCC 50920]|nr:hypothetical protein H632_c3374p0 [Helicosporidium sp. ATCC 50920]|eukprot:KDD72416.1 hypothetical protein H632_c3374p0 [Helicosporidium sp. ATCC 50920]